MKEEEIGARLTLVCYSWTVYKIWVADVLCCFLSQTQSREAAIRPEFRLKMAAFRMTFSIFGHFWWGLQETSFFLSGFAFRTLSTLSFYSVNNSTHSQVLKEGPCLSWHSILLLLFWGVGYYSDTLITALGSHIWGAVTHFWVNERKSGPHVSWKQRGQQPWDKKILLSPEGGGASVLRACWCNTHLVCTYENIHFDCNHTRLPCALQYKQSRFCLPEASGCCVFWEPEMRECSSALRLPASWLIPFNELVAI